MTRRIHGMEPPPRTAKMEGLRRLLTHKALKAGPEDIDKCHSHIIACFDFYNGSSWLIDAEGRLPHYCMCCRSDKEAADNGVAVRQALLHDAAARGFMPSRWEKKVAPAQIWATLFLCGDMRDVASQCASAYKPAPEDEGNFDNLTRDFLARKKGKFSEFCRDPNTPFILGTKLFTLVMLEPLVLAGIKFAKRTNHTKQDLSAQSSTALLAESDVGGVAESDVGGEVVHHPIHALRQAYKSFMAEIALLVEGNVASSWQSAALQAILDYSTLPAERSFLFLRTELLATGGDISLKFEARLNQYPSELVASMGKSPDALRVEMDRFLRKHACDLDPFGSRRAQKVLLRLPPQDRLKAYASLVAAWGGDQRAQNILEENWHAWMKAQNRGKGCKAQRCSQALKACVEQWRRCHLKSGLARGVVPQRRQVMKKGLKQLVKGKVRKASCKRKQVFHAYHAFARERNAEDPGPAHEKSKSWSAQWAGLDSGRKKKYELVAVCSHLDADIDAGILAARRANHAEHTPFHAGDAEFPLRASLLAEYIARHGRDHGTKVFTEERGDVIGVKHIAANGLLAKASKRVATKAFLQSMRCCAEDHLGACATDDKSDFLVIRLGSTALSKALDSLVPTVEKRDKVAGGSEHVDDDESFFKPAPHRCSSLLSVMIEFSLVCDGHRKVIYALLAWRCLNPVREIWVPQSVVDLDADPGHSLFDISAHCYKRVGESSPRLRLAREGVNQSIVFSTSFTLVKNMVKHGPLSAWKLARLNYTCLSLQDSRVTGVVNDCGTLQSWVPTSARKSGRGRGSGSSGDANGGQACLRGNHSIQHILRNYT